MVEGYARKLLGGLLGKFASGTMAKLGKSVAQQAASSTFFVRQHLRARPSGAAAAFIAASPALPVGAASGQ